MDRSPRKTLYVVRLLNEDGPNRYLCGGGSGRSKSHWGPFDRARTYEGRKAAKNSAHQALEWCHRSKTYKPLMQPGSYEIVRIVMGEPV